jgi:hypothetical protein
MRYFSSSKKRFDTLWAEPEPPRESWRLVGLS